MAAKFDGIAGLGWSSISQYHMPTMLDTLAKEKKISNKSFMFDLRHQESKSSLVLGGVDKTKATSDFT